MLYCCQNREISIRWLKQLFSRSDIGFFRFNFIGKYVITKVLALDDFAVHARFYNEEFTDLPDTVSSDDLTFLIGHAPMAREGFMKDEEPILITVENVSEKELEGYKLYLDAMRERRNYPTLRGNP